MKSPKRSALAYVAEYQFGDDNLLTATLHEEQRLRDEARVRNAQPAIRLRDISLSDDDPVINNAKRLQQDQGKYRRDVIEQHNMMLLERLEKIHQQHVPRQFDVSHLSEEVLSAPRATNVGQRRKQQKQIECENEKLQKRLLQARSGTLSNKKLALDADKHRYLAEQISKVTRRRKVRERCQALSDHQQAMATHTRLQLFNDESYIRLYDQSDHEDESKNTYGMMGLSGSKSLSRLDRNKEPGSFAKLPQIHHATTDHPQQHYEHHRDHQHEYHEHKKKTVVKVANSSLPAACSPTLTHTTKLISALDLPRAIRNTAK